jgi:hypothetical protein
LRHKKPQANGGIALQNEKQDWQEVDDGRWEGNGIGREAEIAPGKKGSR